MPVKSGIRYGYWMPAFGGWLRNVEDERMEASWDYVRKLARRSEQIGSYAIVRDSELEVAHELERITDVKRNAQGYANYQQWLQDTQLEQPMSIREYSVSNRGLRSGLIGTPAQVQEQIARFEEAGVILLLLQFSPQLKEMVRFSDRVILATS